LEDVATVLYGGVSGRGWCGVLLLLLLHGARGVLLLRGEVEDEVADEVLLLLRGRDER
jgi:hypothetical protein